MNERNSEDRSSNAKAKKKQNGDRSRLPLKKRKGKWKVIEDQEWSEIEKLLNAKLNVDVRNGIEIAGDMFAYGGLTYTVENSVLTSDTLAQIDSWRAASNKLRRQLQLKPLGSTVKLSRRSIIRRGKKKQAFKRLKHATSLEFLGVFLQRAIEAAELVSLELHGETRNGPIERDLWSAWVTLTARHLRSQNISVTAASLNKTTKLSPFVELIDRLQMHLYRRRPYKASTGSSQNNGTLGRKDTFDDTGRLGHGYFSSRLSRKCGKNVEHGFRGIRQCCRLRAPELSRSHSRNLPG